MTVLHFIRDHWQQIIAVYLLASAAFIIGWTIYLAWFGESDEQRDARRRAEAKRRADTALASFRRKKLLILAEREKANVSRQVNAKIDAIVENVITADSLSQRAREAEGADEADHDNRVEVDGRAA